MRDAKDAAGDKNVLVHGAGITQRALKAGLLDELEIHLIPILMGEGRRLFEHLGVEQRELERVRVLEGEAEVIHLRFVPRVRCLDRSTSRLGRGRSERGELRGRRHRCARSGMGRTPGGGQQTPPHEG
jgi:hypothetical protein